MRQPEQARGIGIESLQHARRRTMPIAEQAGIPITLADPIDENATRLHIKYGVGST